MKLVIAEKPSVAQSLARVIGATIMSEDAKTEEHRRKFLRCVHRNVLQFQMLVGRMILLFSNDATLKELFLLLGS